jgi:3-oxoacyl-[acyl-carrier protein] reductase
MLLQGKKAIVTGCNRGIGKAILEKFAENGADVFAHARKKTNEFEEECRRLETVYGVSVHPVYFDAESGEEMKQAVKEITNVSKDIDILVNNMGIVYSVKLFQMTSMEEMRKEFDVNFFAQMEFTQYISRFMMRKKKGSIVNISSCAGLDGNTGMISYVSGKAALIGATKRLAIELGSYGIRVNSVAPGLTDTEMGGQMREDLEQEMFQRLIIKRKAKPEEIADAVTFLSSDMSSFITGQILRVDGGMLN